MNNKNFFNSLSGFPALIVTIALLGIIFIVSFSVYKKYEINLDYNFQDSIHVSLTPPEQAKRDSLPEDEATSFPVDNISSTE